MRFFRGLTALLLTLALLLGDVSLPLSDVSERTTGGPANVFAARDLPDEARFALSDAASGAASLPAYTLADWILGARAADIPVADAVKTEFLKSVMAAPAPNAKPALALTALGIDARFTATTDRNAPRDFIAAAESAVPFSAVYDATYLLALRDTGLYAFENADAGRAALIGQILNAQLADGSFDANYGAYNMPVDDTAMTLPALAPYYQVAGPVNGVSAASCAAITLAVDDALAFLAGEQLAGGGFDSPYGVNSNTTSVVVIALSALGVDAHDDPRFVSGASAIEHLLSFRATGGLGYDSAVYDAFATVQGCQALVSWLNLRDGNGRENILAPRGAVAPFFDWPNDAAILTGVAADHPSKMSYAVGETFAPAGLRVYAVYNGDNASKTEIPAGDYTLSASAGGAPVDLTQPFLSAGAVSVRIVYGAQSYSFVLSVRSGSGGNPGSEVAAVSVRVTDDRGAVIASDARLPVDPGVTSAIDALKTVLNNNGIPFVLRGGVYVSSVNGLGEFDRGANSGWIYLINGVEPTLSAAAYKLNGGESLHWKYTSDYTREPGSAAWGGTRTDAEAAANVSALVTVRAETGRDGTAVASLGVSEIEAALASPAFSESNGERVLRADILTDEAATGFSLTLDARALSRVAEGANRLILSASFGRIEADGDALRDAAARPGDTVFGLFLGSARFSETARRHIDGNGAARYGHTGTFSLLSGGKPVTLASPLRVCVPYPETEAAGGSVVTFDLGGAAPHPILYSRRNAASGFVIFLAGGSLDFGAGYRESGFADTKGLWCEPYVAFLAGRNAISGTAAGVFDPRGTLLRGQVLQILFNLSGGEPVSGAKTAGDEAAAAFDDVRAGDWDAPAVAWALREGLLTGSRDADGRLTARSREPVTREELATLLDRWLSETGRRAPAENRTAPRFADGDSVSAYAGSAVERLCRMGILDGTPAADGGLLIRPKDTASRAEAAKLFAVASEGAI